ncbi:MAG: aldehyde dehydrogenase family protein [Lachnospiraceae bacterium]|nr:aldehyde dehydrogenase family protein [Lachnospiraceae bacterium]
MEWTKESIHRTVEEQRRFFRTGKTLEVSFRIEMLKKLKKAMAVYEKEIADALRQDLGKSYAEAYFCDTGVVVMEINEILKGLKKWARPELHYSGLTCFPSLITRVYKMPYGVTLLISPFNFPILLTFGVLAASIAGGNTAVIKASSKSKASTAVMQKIVRDIYPEDYVTLVDGGHDIADLCLEERFDKIFYTGSPAVGRHVLEMAARHLTPVALELGGETGNWCIVRKDADIKDAARKIAFFKLCNAGQICININQAAVAEEIAGKFLEELKKAFRKQIGDTPLQNDEYPRLIGKAAYDKCAREADEYRDRIIYGGKGDATTLKYEPTVIWPVNADEPIVRHELFCPLLPVVPFKDDEIDDLLDTIADREHGLSLYLFTKDMRWAKKVMASQQYGGGCVNEVVLQLMVKGAPFNGTGHSGMGAYHGVWGFREFTHPSTVLFGSSHLNLPLREHPYNGKKNAWKLKAVKLFER